MQTSDTAQSQSAERAAGAEGEGGREQTGTRAAEEQAAQAAAEQAVHGKHSAAATAGDASRAFQQAASSFAEHGHPALARTTSELSGELASLAEHLRTRSLDELLQEAGRTARDHPGLFIFGGVALGFALSRLFKASSQPPQQRV